MACTETVQKLLEDHGYQVGVTSIKGTVYFYLPKGNDLLNYLLKIQNGHRFM